MRTLPRAVRRSLTAAALLVPACVAWAGAARAGSMDPTPERFVLQPPGLPAGTTCQEIAANPELAVAAGKVPNVFGCRPDNVAFRNLVSELGFALAPPAMHPARSTGYGGFAITFAASLTHINADDASRAIDGTTRQYWHDGTRGDDGAKTNASPSSLLELYSLNARKGLPLGFEIGGSFGVVGHSSMWVVGGDFRWALNEGFREGVLGHLPDLAVGGGVRTMTGSSKILLTTVGIDAQLSKPFTLASSAVLTPYVGYQRLIIFGNSAVVDLTPNVDALKACGYAGADPVTGGAVCTNRIPPGIPNNSDLNNNVTFDDVRIHRNRGIAGLSYRYDVVYVGAQFLIDLTAPDSENSGVSPARQWTTSLEGGVSF